MKKKFILRKHVQLEDILECIDKAMCEEVPHEVCIRPVKSVRSLEQNDYLHKLVREIARYTGDDLESTKLILKQTLLTPSSTHKLPDGNMYVIYKSSADMSVSELQEFIENIEGWAAVNLGFAMPAK